MPNPISPASPTPTPPKPSPQLRDRLSKFLGQHSTDDNYLDAAGAIRELNQVDGITSQQDQVLRDLFKTAPSNYFSRHGVDADKSFEQVLKHPELSDVQVQAMKIVDSDGAMHGNPLNGQRAAEGVLAHPELNQRQNELLEGVGEAGYLGDQDGLFQAVLEHPGLTANAAKVVHDILPVPLGEFQSSGKPFTEGCSAIMESPISDAQVNLFYDCVYLKGDFGNLQGAVVTRELLAHPQTSASQNMVFQALAHDGKDDTNFDQSAAFSAVAAKSDLSEGNAGELLALFHRACPDPPPTWWQKLTGHVPPPTDYTTPFMKALETGFRGLTPGVSDGLLT